MVAETRRLIEESWTLLEESLVNALRARETIRRSLGIIAESRRVLDAAARDVEARSEVID
jgi:hypothetical protein